MDALDAIKALQDLADRWELWVSISTVAVVVGLIVEYAPDIKRFVSERPIPRKLLLEMIGGILITAGVSGELFFGHWQSSAENKMRAANEAEIARLNAEAETAKLETARLSLEAKIAQSQIATATENAAKANLGIEGARASAVLARADVERARRDTAEMKERAARWENEAEQARLQHEQLKSAVTWRSVPADMATRMRSVLARDKASITIAFTANDPEALLFAIQLSKVFEAAGWKVKPQSRTYAARLFFGITIPRTDSSVAKLVREAFAVSTIPFAVDDIPPPDMSVDFPGESELTIMVGSKKPPV